MFYGCIHLKSLPDISQWNTSNVNDMEEMFSYCNLLKSLPDISKWNTSKVINMKNMFVGCNSLISFPDISKWNTSNVQNMNGLFAGCKSLILLPDISKWNTSNVQNMNGLFLGCKSLISLPNFFRWNTSKVKNMDFMFHGCNTSLKLPNFYIENRIKTNIVLELTYKKKEEAKDKMKILENKFIEKNKEKGKIIYNRSEFELKEYFEDIDKNHKDIKDIIKILLCLDRYIFDLSYMFQNCISLISIKRLYSLDDDYINQELNKVNSNVKIPMRNNNNDLDESNSFYHKSFEESSILEEKNANFLSTNENIKIYVPLKCSNIRNIFDGCVSLVSITDIDKWENYAIDMSYMFSDCKSLKFLPDLSKWDISPFIDDMSYMFHNCRSLKSLPDISNWNILILEI